MPTIVGTSNRSNPPSLLRRAIRRLLGRASVDLGAHEENIIRQSGMFDAAWYLERYPDVAASGMDPITHYVRYGVFEDRNPSTTFDTAFYLSHHVDVAASGMNPFRHYVEFGHGEKRASTAVKGGGTAAGHGLSKISDAEVIMKAGMLDRDYYLATYPDVARAGMDPVRHYLEYGAAEGRNPSAMFDTRYYLANNPDVAASGMNPLVHFCKYGNVELRNPSAEFDMAWYWLTHMVELREDGNPLVHYMTYGRQAGLEIRAVAGLTSRDREMVIAVGRQWLSAEEGQAATLCERLGTAFKRLSLWDEAEQAFRRALAGSWDDAKAHVRLATLLARRGRWWQAVESWTVATALDDTHADWFFHLGEAQEEMNRFGAAAEACQKAIDLDPSHPDWHYRLGYMHEKVGQQALAEAAYIEAVKRDPREDVKAFGIGVFHQARGYWPEAADAYACELEGQPFSADLHFKLGMAHERCYRWQQAETAYRDAIALNPDVPYRHYRLGLVLERQERLAEAAEAYAAAAVLSPKHKSYWHYRCGYVLARLDRHEEACRAWIRTCEQQTIHGEKWPLPQAGSSMDMLASEGNDKPLGDAESVQPRQAGSLASAWLDGYLDQFPSESLIARAISRDTTDPQWHYRLGEVRERHEDWEGAAKAYADAVARSNPHRCAWYYRLGFVLFRAGHFEEACEAFRETRLFRLPYGVNTDAIFRDPAVRQNAWYRENLDALPVRLRTVLYESTHGASIGGNPYAIFEYLLNRPDYHGWTHVWSITPGVAIPVHLRGRVNVIFVEFESDLYRRYLATASHLVNDSTFPYWFSRRPEQKYLNTWHGTPLKTLGKPIHAKEEFLSHRNIQRNLLHATHLISPNKHTSDVLMKDFDVCGIYAGKLAETGYPRIDRTLNASQERVAWVRERLGLKKGMPIALYAPTWRGIFGQTELDVERLCSDLDRLVTLPCQWVFRGHPFIEDLLCDAGLPVTIAPREMDTSDVLAVSDILVTDYSSIFFDFLPTRRPIFYYCYDLEDYAHSRGLYFDIHEMPGTVCDDIDALAAGVAQQLNGGTRNDAGYDAFLNRFCPHEDGQATARTVAFFLEDNSDQVVTRYRNERPSLLFFGGHFAPNGINTSFLNLMYALQSAGKYQITVAVEPNRIKREPVWLDDFHKLPHEVAVLGKVGRMVMNPEQEWVARKFRARRGFSSAAMHGVFQDAYRHEYWRAFGDARIDALVDFDGYGAYWTTLFGIGSNNARKFCWLHNDFFEEFILKHPYLRSQFAIYPEYDALVSVSSQMAAVNRNKLSSRFFIDPHKFKHCINIIDSSQISSLAKEPLDRDLVSWLEGVTTFLTMGRMSPEKDQAKLIDAFARVHVRYPKTRLLILGDGMLRQTLVLQIEQLKLGKAVCLAGQRSNPFPPLQHCDCFVLPSNHEGQPMVLLEAMALGKPIIATDIDGNRGVLKDGYGELVENSVAGLEQGMLRFLRGECTFHSFDPESYRTRALQQFDTLIEGTGQLMM